MPQNGWKQVKASLADPNNRILFNRVYDTATATRNLTGRGGRQTTSMLLTELMKHPNYDQWKY